MHRAGEAGEKKEQEREAPHNVNGDSLPGSEIKTEDRICMRCEQDKAGHDAVYLVGALYRHPKLLLEELRVLHGSSPRHS